MRSKSAPTCIYRYTHLVDENETWMVIVIWGALPQQLAISLLTAEISKAWYLVWIQYRDSVRTSPISLWQFLCVVRREGGCRKGRGGYAGRLP